MRTWAVAHGPRFVSGTALSSEKGSRGSHAQRERPTRLRLEEVPQTDHQGWPLPGSQEEAVLREPVRSTAAEGQGRGSPKGEARASSGTVLSQEYYTDGTHYRY